jgi:hypothetical protein
LFGGSKILNDCLLAGLRVAVVAGERYCGKASWVREAVGKQPERSHLIAKLGLLVVQIGEFSLRLCPSVNAGLTDLVVFVGQRVGVFGRGRLDWQWAPRRVGTPCPDLCQRRGVSLDVTGCPALAADRVLLRLSGGGQCGNPGRLRLSVGGGGEQTSGALLDLVGDRSKRLGLVGERLGEGAFSFGEYRL